jgi:hypothetical protein
MKSQSKAADNQSKLLGLFLNQKDGADILL